MSAVEETIDADLEPVPPMCLASPVREGLTNVLVIEDSRTQARMICSALHAQGLTCEIATSGQEARAFLQERGAELLLLDYELPDMSGSRLIDQLRTAGHEIPFVVMTARGNETVAVQFMKRGALDYLVKDSGFLSFLPEVTQRHLREARSQRILREAEHALRAAEQRVVRIIEASPEAFLSLAEDGTILDWNTAAERTFGWHAQEIVGRSILETLVPEDLRDDMQRFLRQFQSSHQLGELGQRFESTAVRQDTATIFVEVSASPMQVGDAWVINAFVHDVSDRKEMESQLVQSDKMASIGQLAAGVAHEINNPIGFVTSNLGTLANYVQSYERILKGFETALSGLEPEIRSHVVQALAPVEKMWREEDLDYIRQDVPALLEESTGGLQRVKEIVQNLKSFARLDEAVVKEADINEGLESTLKVVWNELKYRCDVVRKYGQLPLLQCFPGQLNQVFMNLLVNAAQAITEHGTITIETSATDTDVFVRIRDTGRGIPPENLTRLFTPFFTTKPVGSGTGLGLSISYGIVKKHGGEIRVDSEVGVGTGFEIRLPLKGLEP